MLIFARSLSMHSLLSHMKTTMHARYIIMVVHWHALACITSIACILILHR